MKYAVEELRKKRHRSIEARPASGEDMVQYYVFLIQAGDLGRGGVLSVLCDNMGIYADG